jgi:23S rRNA pseudouridine2605 synthase
MAGGALRGQPARQEPPPGQRRQGSAGKPAGSRAGQPPGAAKTAQGYIGADSFSRQRGRQQRSGPGGQQRGGPSGRQRSGTGGRRG